MQTEHKRIEKERNKLKVEGEENAFKKTMETTQHGQIIMTINNMYGNIVEKANADLKFAGAGGDKEDQTPVFKDGGNKTSTFDHASSTEKNAIYQLDYIALKLDALKKLANKISENISGPLKQKYGREGNDKSDEIEKIR